MKIKIISAYNSNYKSLSDLSFQTIDFFSKLNNFDFERFLISSYDRPFAWFKIKKIIEEIENKKYDYLVWIDADAIIINNNFYVKKIIEEKYNFYISKDFNGINTGVFMIKSCDYIKDFFLKVYSLTEFLFHNTWEQAAIIKLINENYKNIQDHIKYIDQKIFNAYDYRLFGFDENHEGHFNNDSFIVHYPSLPLGVRLENMTRLLNKKL